MSNNAKPLVYFQHRKLVALVEHPHSREVPFSEKDVIPFLRDIFTGPRNYDTLYNDHDNEKLLEVLGDIGINVEEINSQGGVTFDLSPERSPVLSFSTAENVVYSMATFSFEYPTGMSQDGIAQLEGKIARREDDDPVKSRELLERDDSYLLYLTGELNAVLASGKRADDTAQLRAIAPNWLLGGGQSQVSTGGPETPPIAPGDITDLDAAAAKLHKPWDFFVSAQDLSPSRAMLPQPLPGFEAFQNLFNKDYCSQQVHVAILDTAPSKDTLESGFGKWDKPDSLYAQLLKAKGVLSNNNLEVTYGNDFKITYYNDSEDPQFEDTFGLKDHDYDMSDHGLFIAGIIRTLAPEAHIHLIQVLNNYGVGTMAALLEGIMRLRAEILQPGGITVVNSSLTITFPFDESQMNPAEGSWMEVLWKILHEIMGDALKNLLVLNVRTFYELLKMPDTMLFAAAGNDGEKNKADAEARYPAAFEGVYGVGAWGAYYSNKADEQSEERFLAFGGDADTLATGGMLGLYTRPEFPDKSPNALGLARWAGTSFATAVATGTFARLIQRACTSDEAKIFMQLAVRESIEPSPDKGNILPVRQGP
jgi:hypothetical protein